MKRFLMTWLLVGLSACATTPETVEAKIVKTCTYSGFFAAAGTGAVLVVPMAALPVSLLHAGVVTICADPAAYAHDAAAVANALAAFKQAARP